MQQSEGAQARPIRILIADDDPSVRSTLADLFTSFPGFELVAQAEDADEAVAASALHRPDVALLDVRMPGGGGPSAAKRIRYRETVANGLESASRAFIGMLRGENVGKQLVKLV